MYIYSFTEEKDPLHFAVEQGNVKAVITLLEASNNNNSRDINSLDSYYKVSALTVACATGNVEMVKELLKRSAQVDVGGLRLRRCAFDEAQNFPLLISLLLKPTQDKVDNFKENATQTDAEKAKIALLSFSLADFYWKKIITAKCTKLAGKEIQVSEKDIIHLEKYYNLADLLSKELKKNNNILTALTWRKGYHSFLKREYIQATSIWAESAVLGKESKDLFRVLLILETCHYVIESVSKGEGDVKGYEKLFLPYKEVQESEELKNIFIQLMGHIVKKSHLTTLITLQVTLNFLKPITSPLNKISTANFSNWLFEVDNKLREGTECVETLKNVIETSHSFDEILQAMTNCSNFYLKTHDNTLFTPLYASVVKICEQFVLVTNVKNSNIKKYQKLVDELLKMNHPAGIQAIDIVLRDFIYRNLKWLYKPERIDLLETCLFLSLFCLDKLIDLNYFIEINYDLIRLDLVNIIKAREEKINLSKVPYAFKREQEGEDSLSVLEKLTSFANDDKHFDKIRSLRYLFFKYPQLLSKQSYLRLALLILPTMAIDQEYHECVEVCSTALDYAIDSKNEDWIVGFICYMLHAGTVAIREGKIRKINPEFLIDKISNGISSLTSQKYKILKTLKTDITDTFLSQVSEFFKTNQRNVPYLKCSMLKLKLSKFHSDSIQMERDARLIINHFSLIAKTHVDDFLLLFEEVWNLFETCDLVNELVELTTILIPIYKDQNLFQEKLEKLMQLPFKLKLKDTEHAINLNNMLMYIIASVKGKTDWENVYELSIELFHIVTDLIDNDNPTYPDWMNELASLKLDLAANYERKGNNQLELQSKLDAIEAYKTAKNTSELLKISMPLMETVVNKIKELIEKQEFLLATDLLEQMRLCSKNNAGIKSFPQYHDLKVQVHIGLAICYLREAKIEKIDPHCGITESPYQIAELHYKMANKALLKVEKCRATLLKLNLDDIFQEIEKNTKANLPTLSSKKSKEDLSNSVITVSNRQPRLSKEKEKEKKKNEQTATTYHNNNNNAQTEKKLIPSLHSLPPHMLVGEPMHGASFLNEKNSTLYPVLDLSSKDIKKMNVRNPYRLQLFKNCILQGTITTAFGHNGIKYAGSFWEIKVNGPDRLRGELENKDEKNYVIFRTRFKK